MVGMVLNVVCWRLESRT